jgi:cysteine-rich repeat protein
VEAGFTCSGTPSVCAAAAAAVCGDGRLAAGEACDDGNATSGDGCSATCAVEAGFTCSGTPSVCAAFAWDVALWDQGTWQ